MVTRNTTLSDGKRGWTIRVDWVSYRACERLIATSLVPGHYHIPISRDPNRYLAVAIAPLGTQFRICRLYIDRFLTLVRESLANNRDW